MTAAPIGDPAQRAIARLEQEIEEARSAGEDFRLGNALVEQAGYHLLRLDTPAVRRCFEEARRTYQRNGNTEDVARCLLHLSRFAESEGDTEQAGEYLDLSYWLFERVGDLAGQGEALAEQAERALRGEQVDLAEHRYQQAAERFAASGEARREVDALKAVALSRQMANDAAGAIVGFHVALQRAEALGDPGQVLEITLALGGLHTTSGEPAAARSLLEQAEVLAQQQQDARSGIMALVLRGALASRAGAHVEGIRLADRARTLAVGALDVAGYMHAVLLLARLHEAHGDDAGAVGVLLRAGNGLADLGGDDARRPIDLILDSVNSRWGKARYERALRSFIAQRRRALAATPGPQAGDDG